MRKHHIRKMLDFRIDTFLSVCKNMNYTKTAKELNITQPGVSQHIKYLEKYYGVKLFEYNNKKLILTQAGIELRESMISIKNDDMHLKNSIKEHSSQKQILKFGATLTAGDFFVSEQIVPYIMKNANIQLDFRISNTKTLLDLLEEGKIDFAVVEGYFKKSNYEFRTVSKEKYVLIAPIDFPLDNVDDINQLFDYNVLLREEGSGTREIIEKFLTQRGYNFTDFKNISTINSIHVIKKLVEKGFGISFIYEIAVKKELSEGKIKTIEINNCDIYHEFNYIWRKNSVFYDFYEELCSLLIMK